MEELLSEPLKQNFSTQHFTDSFSHTHFNISEKKIVEMIGINGLTLSI